jgi:hypothetical protein
MPAKQSKYQIKAEMHLSNILYSYTYNVIQLLHFFWDTLWRDLDRISAQSNVRWAPFVPAKGHDPKNLQSTITQYLHVYDFRGTM